MNKISYAEFHEEWEDLYSDSPIQEKICSVLLAKDGSDVAQKLIQQKLAKRKQLSIQQTRDCLHIALALDMFILEFSEQNIGKQ